MSKLDQAIVLATELHSGQLDKAGKPYILHCLRVMLAVCVENYEIEYPAVPIAAVLHDVMEDTGFSLAQISYRFGPTVTDAVDVLTRRKDEPWLAFIYRVKQNRIARMVKIADLKDNSDPKRLNLLPKETALRLRAKYFKALRIIE